ncbi:hypothetical protein ADK52_38110 [Streptomyces sp. WM6372]|uniref:hypothetical protein n=1 Tax=Streptomyces sp. WM6372 TaxID=1415555 RepID=UPI0006AFA66F|nr:hypothetical protein [Streptomyces sp. WM6372]KOU13789.1 hypothetical protein ADK52_38110 [Streptomyces sp. WM6372]
MNRQTNRYRYRGLVLLAAPLLASSVALTPAFAAQGRTAAAGAARAPVAPSCELTPGSGGGKPGDSLRYDLHLSGFAPNQSVRVEGKSSFRTTVDGAGSLDRQGVRYGTYGVSYRESGSQQGKHVSCTTPPREQKPGSGKGSVQVTKVEVLTLTKSGSTVDCTKPPKLEFDGKITGTGQGKVRYFWTYASSADPISSGTAEFTPGTTSVSLFKVVEGSVMANTKTVSAFVTLHVPDFNMTARSENVQVTCT